jgi:hypothetical protein
MMLHFLGADEIVNILELSGASVPAENEPNSSLGDLAQTSAELTEATGLTSHNRFPGIQSDFSTLDMFDWVRVPYLFITR